MEAHQLEKNLRQMGEAISLLIDKKKTTSALVLIYSAIDTMAWLNTAQASTTRRNFKQWVDKYMLPESGLSCTAADLYGARCGLVHTFTADSSLSASGGVRKVYYAWGTADVDGLQRSMDVLGRDDVVAVKLEELFSAWMAGALRFVGEIVKDEKRWAIAARKADRFFMNMDPVHIERFLALHPEE